MGVNRKGDKMKYRHEWKHEINEMDKRVLLSRLPLIMQKDSHAKGDGYYIRSLYFDSINDKALREKVDGVNHREKFRIRYYNDDLTYITLEKKSKDNGLCAKQMCQITKEEAQKLVDGDFTWLATDKRPLCFELYTKMVLDGIRPKTIVDYKRIPFVYGPGNVRVTIDYDIRTGLSSTDFLNTKTVTMPAGDAPIILEVKWDEFLPDIVKDAVALNSRRVSAFSKYEQCRIYG